MEKNDKNEEAVNHPDHYRPGTYEAIKVIEAWKLGFHLGSAVKYIARIGRKANDVEDAKKAIWYLQRWIDKQGEGEPKTEFAILVNGVTHVVDREHQSHSDIVRLAFGKNGRNSSYTVTFDKAGTPMDMRATGSLLFGEFVPVTNGTIFNVADTGNA